jgi:hypothetical protein
MAVTDYRTSTTGITASHLSSGRPPSKISRLGLFLGLTFLVQIAEKGEAKAFDVVQVTVAEIIKDKVIVGHSLWNDLSGG